MSDQLSKVEDRHIAAAFREVVGPDGGRIKNAEICDFIMQRSRELASIESAATGELDSPTPAEVDEAVKALQSVAGQYEEGSCAKSNLLIASVLVATLARQLAEKTKLADDVYEMLSAQLTEAFAEKVDQRIRAEQAESQLAEATRRLGEVEGLLREAAGHMKRGRAYYSEYHDFIERITALTKEPTK